MTLAMCEVTAGPFGPPGSPIEGVLLRVAVMSRQPTAGESGPTIPGFFGIPGGLNSWGVPFFRPFPAVPEYGPNVAEDGSVITSDTQEFYSDEDGMLTFTVPQGWQILVDCASAGLQAVVCTVPSTDTATLADLMSPRPYRRPWSF